MKWLTAALIILLGATTTGATFHNSNQTEVYWQGETDVDMLNQVRKDLAVAAARGRSLKVNLISPGGPVVVCLEIARIIRNASDAGTKVEIHGAGVVASCATFVLAAGTPGERYISETTLFLVHPPSSGYDRSCLAYKEKPENENEKIVNELFRLMWATYARMTGKPLEVVKTWTECGKEIVGVQKAIEMGIADKVEK